jgi:hypothetical protein
MWPAYKWAESIEDHPISGELEFKISRGAIRVHSLVNIIRGDI